MGTKLERKSARFSDTDAEVREQAMNGAMGRCWREFLLPLYLKLGLGPLLKALVLQRHFR